MERIERMIEAAIRDREVLRNNGGGTAAGKEKKKAAWQRILSQFVPLFTMLFIKKFEISILQLITNVLTCC